MEQDCILKLPFEFNPQEIITRGSTTEENLNLIRSYVEHLNRKPVPQVIQDEMLIIFLISCNNDIDLTKKTIISYYECKKDAPEIFDDRDMQSTSIQQALSTVHLSSIPVRTDSNDVIHYFKLSDTNYKNFDLISIMKISYMLMDISQEKNPPDGLIVIIDAKGAGLLHMTRIKINAIKKYIHFLQEGLPMRMKEIHILNSPYFVDKLMEIVKVFMKNELLNLLYIHPPDMDLEKLFQLVPKKCLPMEYGGDLPSETELHSVTMEKFYSKQEFWNLEETLRKQFH